MLYYQFQSHLMKHNGWSISQPENSGMGGHLDTFHIGSSPQSDISSQLKMNSKKTSRKSSSEISEIVCL